MPKKMKGDTVCVTGASGFIASWLVMRLIERGYFIRATVRNPESPLKQYDESCWTDADFCYAQKMPIWINNHYSYTTGNKALYKLMTMGHAVHLEDVCDARIFLFEHPEAHGRYICSNHDFIIFDLVKSLGQKYPECNIPTEFEGVEESLKVVPCSSKKSMDLGFKFRYDSAEYNMGDLCAEVVEFCRRKGVLP
ncbi:hypothetical protein JCGZ_04461 [Jatropha curcas]|uniref:NAD-dependent epimerase/dehydratase domain-containing protein n=1 Tax=Jatropha curcas TaxID=180498 RepID=A0A067KQN9_JATCU|nr:hypothetical protein JCGZ_04461 [Jatropha curcas]